MPDTPILIDPLATAVKQPENVLRFATMFGVPALLALYFAWALVSGQAAVLGNIERMLYAQQAQVKEVADVARETAITTMAAQARIEGYMRQICVNGAETNAERNACLSVR